MKRLLLATNFLLVLMVIGTSITFAGSLQGLKAPIAGHKPDIVPNITAGFKTVWTKFHRRNYF